MFQPETGPSLPQTLEFVVAFSPSQEKELKFVAGAAGKVRGE
jgi:hypothetical protein